MDSSAIQRRVQELSEQKNTLDGLEMSNLMRITETAYNEVEGALYDEIKGEWWVGLGGPIALIAERYINESRYRSVYEKVKYAKGWLDQARATQSDAIKRIALKQSFSDSAHALQLIAAEKKKGGNASAIYNRAKETVGDEFGILGNRIFLGAIVAAAAVAVMNKSGKGKR